MSPAPLYELDRPLGQGATGRVSHGVLTEPFADWSRGQEIAVKMPRPEFALDPIVRASFQRERRVARAVRHPGLVRVIHHGLTEDGPVLVMQYVPGRSLRALLDAEGRLAEPLVRTVGRQLADVLAALHTAGWLHGDVSPDNVRLDEDGRAVLIDLGFAQSVDDAVAERGTPQYLSPEQARGAAPTTASEVFTLGVVLYELATGAHPFGAADEVQLLERIAAARAEKPSHHDPRLTSFLDGLLAALMHPDPEQRPTASEAAEYLAHGESAPWWRRRVVFGPEARTADEAWSSLHLTPLVGRDRELVALSEAYESARTQGGQVIWLEGEPGSGKSRLVSEFVARVRAGEHPPTYLYGRSSEFLEQRPGLAVRALLRRWLKLPADAAPGVRETRLLDQLLPPETAHTLSLTLDPDHEGSLPMPEPSALAAWLLALARSTPLVVFLDDVNFAGAGTLDVLARVIDGCADAHALLVLGLRTGCAPFDPAGVERLRARARSRIHARTLTLEPLEEKDILELVEHVFSQGSPRLRLAHVLLERSHGNAGHLQEIVRSLEPRGLARRDAQGALELLVTPDELPHAPGVSRAIAEAYRALPAGARPWLRRFAVVGGNIEPEFLARAFGPVSRQEIDEQLARFERERWLVSTGARYRFARPAQREAIYKTISPERRRNMHAAAARALRPAKGERVSIGTAFQRAYHLRAAGAHAELLTVVPPLLAALREHGHPMRRATVAAWGLEALDQLPRDDERRRIEIDLLDVAADATDQQGARSLQRSWLDRLSDIELDPGDDATTVGRVYLLHGRYSAAVGQLGLARGMFRNALELFGKDDARGFESDAAREFAEVQARVGEVAEAERLGRRALDRAPDDLRRARAQLALATTSILGDRYEEAQRNVDAALQALRRKRGAGEGRAALARAYMLRGRIYRVLGLPRRAFGALQRARRLSVQAGVRSLEAEVNARVGRLLIDVGREHEAELELREALLLAQEIDDAHAQALARVFLGSLLAEQDDPEGGRVLARAVEQASASGLHRLEALALALEARVERQAGEFARALTLSERAMGWLANLGAELPDRVVIVGTRALLLADVERPDEARELERALDRTVRRVNERLRSPILRAGHRRVLDALLRAARSPLGPVYPRSIVQDLPPLR